jgi:OOP family OmpA-OmpF porin
LVFECHATQCGGFDFRFETEVLPGPNMYVDITDYRYLTALRGDPADPLQAVGVLTSVTAQSAYVQIIAADARRASATVLETEVPAPEAVSEPVAPAGVPAAEGLLATELLEQGHVVLGDLEFATGTSDLGEGPFASLAELAAVLGSDPSVRMVLVGHTDATGSREANVSVSRARAGSVRDRLVARFDIDPDRLEADGIAYLAPVAPNWTSEGRAQNRRVTAILLREN